MNRNNSVVTAPSTPADHQYGIVCMDCTISFPPAERSFPSYYYRTLRTTETLHPARLKRPHHFIPLFDPRAGDPPTELRPAVCRFRGKVLAGSRKLRIFAND